MLTHVVLIALPFKGLMIEFKGGKKGKEGG
jgi:hypothetical protein